MAYNAETGCLVGYIYCIENNINGKKYIGQTTLTIKYRWAKHKYESNKANPYGTLARAIKKYGVENFDIYELVHVESKDHQEVVDSLNELEIFFIEIHDTLVTSNHGYNIQVGGDNNSRHNPICTYDMDGNFLNEFFNVEETANYYNTHYTVVKRICDGKQGNYKNTIVFRYKNDDFNKYSIERKLTINKKQVKPVDVYDTKTHKLIKTYESLNQCARDIDVAPATISYICRGKNIPTGDYIFRFHGDPIDKYPIEYVVPNTVKVNQYDKYNNFIRTYDSITDAGKATGINNKYIGYYCSHNIKKVMDFKWFYADDPNQPDKLKIIV